MAKKIDTGIVRQFVKVSDGRIGAIIANDQCGGVFRGHCNIWFGESDENGSPIVRQLCIIDDWEAIDAPIADNDKEEYFDRPW